ncbi:MAG TPA: ABC transporter permease subunit [Lacipirellulaceae bacterium]|nr:ABC transporter permease subunit [Lacipirellulaceae bacterium]
MPNLAQRNRALAIGLVLLLIASAIVVTLWQLDPRVGRLWLNSARLALTTCLIALPFGTLLAAAIFKSDVPGRRLAALILAGMLFVPLYLVTGAWDSGFGIQGWHTLATNPQLTHQPWLAGWRAAVWVHALAAVPWVVLIVGASFRTVEAEIEEDAATCATPRKVMWYVSIRRATPAIVLAGVWVAIMTTTEISVTDFFQVRTFAEEVYTQAVLGTFDFATAGPSSGNGAPSVLSAIGLWSGLLLSTGLALAAIAAAGRLFVDLTDATHRPPWIWRLRNWRWPAAIVLWLSMFLLAGVPLGNLLYKAGVQVTATPSGHIRHWSAPTVIESLVAAPRQFSGELWLSTRISVAAATAALAIAIPLAWSMRGSLAKTPATLSVLRSPWLRLFAITVCLTIPGPLLGIIVIRILNRPPNSLFASLAALYDSNFAPWLVQTIRAVPLATLIMWPALASVPQVMLDTAATDGTGSLGRLFRIALPQRWPAVAAAWLVSFAVAIGELAATILVMPPQRGATALSIQIFQLLHYGVDDRVAAICLFTVFATAAITGIAVTLLKRRM